MSELHPVVAVTGSSGAGTSTVKTAFEHIFRRLELTAAVIEGDSFHRYDRAAMGRAVQEAEEKGTHISHFGPEANLLKELEELFQHYGRTGEGQRRFYIHDVEEGHKFGQEPGTFTPWEDVPKDTDLLFYEGLHGAMVNAKDRGELDLTVVAEPERPGEDGLFDSICRWYQKAR